jgi:hypothetical protein
MARFRDQSRSIVVSKSRMRGGYFVLYINSLRLIFDVSARICQSVKALLHRVAKSEL